MKNKKSSAIVAYGIAISTGDGEWVRSVKQFRRFGDAYNWGMRNFYEWPACTIIGWHADKTWEIVEE